jgi:hypothetical protein
MPKDVCSPVSIKGSRVGSGAPMSPGARTNPSRASADSVPDQPRNEPEPKQQTQEDARRSKRPAPSLPTDE